MKIDTMLTELEIQLLEHELMACELHSFENTEAIEALLNEPSDPGDPGDMAQWALENLDAA